MPWDEYLSEDIDEMFDELRSLPHSPEAPKLWEEVDEQEWQVHRQLSIPQGEMGYSPEPTCLCVHSSRRRWRNQYSSGTYVHVDTYFSPQWSDQDLEEMAYGPCPAVEDLWQILPEPQVSQESQLQVSQEPEPQPQEIQPQIPTPAEDINRDVYPVSNHVRIQISMKQKGINVKGRYENFEIPNVPLEEIYDACLTLLTHFPKQPRKHIDFYTRVQLQNKVNGKMQGGRNLSLHLATPEVVADFLREIFDGSGWLSPKGLASPKDSCPKTPTTPEPKVPPTLGDHVEIPSADLDRASVGNDFSFPEDLCF